VPLELVGLPTVADVREKRLEILRGTLRETLLGDGFDRYRAVVEPLSDEFASSTSRSPRSASPTRARGAEDTAELAPATLPPAFGARGQGDRGGPIGARNPPSPACDAVGGAGSRPPPRRGTRRRTGRRRRALSQASKTEATSANRDPVARSRRARPRPFAATA
jgi:ATP-dependent RNA helicase DeaD